MKNSIVRILINEYNAMRTEQRDTINQQYSIINWTITCVGALFGFWCYLYQSSMLSNPQTISTIANAIFYVLIPFASSIMGVVWIECLYRVLRMGVYIYDLERQINIMIGHKSIKW